MFIFESRRDKWGFVGGLMLLGLIAGGIGWAATGSAWWMLSLIPAGPVALCDCAQK